MASDLLPSDSTLAVYVLMASVLSVRLVSKVKYTWARTLSEQTKRAHTIDKNASNALLGLMHAPYSSMVSEQLALQHQVSKGHLQDLLSLWHRTH